MRVEIEKAARTGFCFGVRRAIDILEKTVRERGGVETLGAVVHNQQVLQRLAGIGVRVIHDLDETQGGAIAIGSHGVSPEVEAKIRARRLDVVNTTCPFVHRAQIAARRLAEAGFFVVVYGEADHPEVKGILGWAGGRGPAALGVDSLSSLQPLPRRLGILSQTTQIPECFTEFAKQVVSCALSKDAELRIIDTICHDIRDRQQTALDLARRVDLMFVIGSHDSANTNHLADLCGTVTETHLVETAKDVQLSWLRGHSRVGVTGGASTAEETIEEVIARLQAVAE
jgi:4-hydroxy-3-methylbut-2-enyl diphosphate reductase